MKRSASSGLPRWLVTVAGSAAVAISLAASELGIDTGEAWGPRRKVVLLLGLVVLVVAQYSALNRFVHSTWTALAHALGLPPLAATLARQFPFSEGLRRPLSRFAHSIGLSAPSELSPASSWAEGQTSEPGKEITHLSLVKRLSLLALVLAIGGTYVWFASAGYWFRWPEGTSYYDMLADGFVHGRTSLMVEPDPRLVDLPNPYSMEARQDIPILWDASFFRGMYFLYWGPVPAALLVLPKIAFHREIADLPIVLAAACATLIFSTLILVFLWRRYFVERLPHWLLLAGVLLVGFGLPVLWVLNSPNAYEAAIASGMAFFLGGVYAALPALVSDTTSRLRLALAGTMLALAVGSRAVLLVPTIVLTGFVVVRLFKQRRASPASAVASLIVPLVVGATLLGGYNFERFGSPFETGFRYQLTGRDETLSEVFDPVYLIPNTYNYMLRSYRTLSVFPFLKPIWGVEDVPYLSSNLPLTLRTPPMYTPQLVSGILVSTPAHLFTLFLAWWVVWGHAARAPGRIDRAPSSSALRSAVAVLLMVAVFASLPVGLYHWNANRFLMDFMPLVAILSAVGAWIAVERNRSPTANRIAIRVLVAAAILASALVAFLLAVSGDQLRFEKLNPALFEWITRALA